MSNRSIKELYFIRHGETDWNILGKKQGCENDIELNKLGIEQAKKTGNYLYNYRLNSGTFDLIISSGLKRTNETAKIIANKIGYNKEIMIMEEFTEICYGELSGYTHDELINKFETYKKREKLLKDEIDPIKRLEILNKNNKIYNEEYDYELFKDIKKRIKKGLRQLDDIEEKKILIVSHGGTIQHILKIITGIEDVIKYGSNCSITYIKLYQIIKKNKIKKKYKVKMLMNDEHLN